MQEIKNVLNVCEFLTVFMHVINELRSVRGLLAVLVWIASSIDLKDEALSVFFLAPSTTQYNNSYSFFFIFYLLNQNKD